MTAEHSGSPDAVHRHRDRLVELAIQGNRDEPDERLVAWVAEPGMAEIGLLRAMPAPQVHGEDGSLAVVMSRELAKTLLGRVCPRLLDWIPEDGAGPRRQLPVIHSARQGFRSLTIDYEV